MRAWGLFLMVVQDPDDRWWSWSWLIVPLLVVIGAVLLSLYFNSRAKKKPQKAPTWHGLTRALWLVLVVGAIIYNLLWTSAISNWAVHAQNEVHGTTPGDPAGDHHQPPCPPFSPC